MRLRSYLYLLELEVEYKLERHYITEIIRWDRHLSYARDRLIFKQGEGNINSLASMYTEASNRYKDIILDE